MVIENVNKKTKKQTKQKQKHERYIKNIIKKEEDTIPKQPTN